MVVFAEIITNDSLLLVWMSPQTSQREAGFPVSDHIAHREHCPSHAAYDGNSVRFSVRIGPWRLLSNFPPREPVVVCSRNRVWLGNALQIAVPQTSTIDRVSFPSSRPLSGVEQPKPHAQAVISNLAKRYRSS